MTGHHYYWCAGLNTNNLDGCVKRIEDFFLEEVILFQLQQHIMELGELDGVLQQEKEDAATLVEKLDGLRQKLLEAEETARQLQRKESCEAFAVTKLTAELMDQYIENVAVYSDDDVRITWK